MADRVERVVVEVAAAAPDVRAALPERRGLAGGENPTGDRTLAADAYADEMLTERVGGLDGVGEVASEEREGVLDVGEGLAVALDPLDGSSNLRSNNLMGTVVSVYDAPLPAGGDDLLAAGYVLYGPVTTMTVVRDGTVTEYLVTDGKRSVIDEDVTLPDDPTVYGFGGRRPDWPDDFAAFVETVEADESIKLRYGGAMVGDVNQVLTYGGIFGYPALTSAPEGKLRTQFEAVPAAAIVEAAGGASTDGEGSILDGTPSELHGRTPFHVGNRSLVDRLESELDRA
ncbi:MAG: class 1 fructose-bisphosphatase [Haloferacaceae archaeon]